MLLPQPGNDLQLLRRLYHLGFRLQVAGAVFRSGKRFGQARAVGVDRLGNRLAEIGPQVIPVRDLLGLWRPDPPALPVTTGAVRQMTFIPGWSWSQAARSSPSRPS
jgi:hypothetical protein